MHDGTLAGRWWDAGLGGECRLAPIHGVYLPYMADKRRLGSALDISAKNPIFMVSTAKPRNHWWFGRVFHTGRPTKRKECQFCHFGGFTEKPGAPRTRSSLQGAAPNGGGQGSKSLKTKKYFSVWWIWVLGFPGFPGWFKSRKTVLTVCFD